MQLNQATLGFKKITKDEENFSLDGLIEPTFYNFGEDDVVVHHTTVKTGEQFLAGVTGFVMNGEISIKFKGNGRRELLLYYGDPVTNC